MESSSITAMPADWWRNYTWLNGSETNVTDEFQPCWSFVEDHAVVILCLLAGNIIVNFICLLMLLRCHLWNAAMYGFLCYSGLFSLILVFYVGFQLSAYSAVSIRYREDTFALSYCYGAVYLLWLLAADKRNGHVAQVLLHFIVPPLIAMLMEVFILFIEPPNECLISNSFSHVISVFASALLIFIIFNFFFVLTKVFKGHFAATSATSTRSAAAARTSAMNTATREEFTRTVVRRFGLFTPFIIPHALRLLNTLVFFVMLSPFIACSIFQSYLSKWLADVSRDVILYFISFAMLFLFPAFLAIAWMTYLEVCLKRWTRESINQIALVPVDNGGEYDNERDGLD